MKIIEFKSVVENYLKEKEGLKPNTIRKVSTDDERGFLLNQRTATHIRIRNTKTGESFLREITDITFWDGWYIISWKHPEAKA